MLDRKYILDNLDAVRENCRNRNVTADLDRFVELETTRRTKQRELEDLNKEANAIAKTIGGASDAEERAARVEAGRAAREKITILAAKLKEIESETDGIVRSIPNQTHPDAPRGADDSANTEIALGGWAKPEFDFAPLDHVEIAKRLDLIDFEAGSRVAGAGFYFLKNEAVLLELALQQYAVHRLMKAGYIPMSTPDLARNEILHGTGYIPRGNETQIYSIADTDLSLVATAEIPLGGMLAGETVEAEQLPIKFCGTSHCFRTEAGAAGKASRGLYRVHQFTKVEMFAFALPDQSESLHAEMLAMERGLFDGLGLAYRVVDTATGDLGGPAYRKYDLEAWMPGRGEYGEVTSTSNCTDYQARRLGARYKIKGEKGTHFLHTLNGTAIAISRALVTILETYQQKDGSVVVPEVLRPWVGLDLIAR